MPAESRRRRCLRWHGPVWPVCLVVLLILGPTSPVRSQTDPMDESWRWSRFTTTSGLPSDNIGSVVETSDGTVWAVTAKGLAWFDDYHWHAMGPAEGVTVPITSLVPAGGGDQVLAAGDGMLLQGDSRGFRRLAITDPENGLLRVDRAAVLPDGGLLLLSGMQLWEAREGRAVPHRDGLLEDPRSQVFGLWQTRRSIWINLDDGLLRYTPGGWTWILRFPGSGLIRFEAIAEGTDGSLIANLTHPDNLADLYEIVGAARTVRRLEGWKGSDPPVAFDVGPDGSALVIRQSGTIQVRRDGRWRTRAAPYLGFRNITSLWFRDDGDLWAGTRDGLLFCEIDSRLWTRWRYPDPDPHNRIHEILQTRDGTIWVGTEGGLVVHRSDGSVESIDQAGGIPLGTVLGLAEDRDGAIWVTGQLGRPGVCRWDGTRWEWFGPDQGLAGTVFHKVRLDRQGRIWLLGISLSYPELGVEPGPEPGAFVREGGRFTRWGEPEGLPSGRVYAFEQTADGALWFGTMGGLSRWQDGAWTHWNRSNGLKNDRTYTLAVDPGGTVWFAHQTEQLGFVRDGVPGYLAPGTGPALEAIWDLRIAPDGVLWISGRGGLCRFDGTRTVHLTTAEGLSSLYLWPVLPSADRVYIGNLGAGVDILDLGEAHVPSPRTILDPPAVEGRSVLFRWRSNAFWGQLQPEAIKTRWRLDEGAWSHWEVRNELRLGEVAPGRHRLTIQAMGLLGDVETAGEAVAFRIPPPLWLQPLVAFPLLVLLAAVVGLVVTNALRDRRYLVDLQASERKYRTLFEGANDAIMILDPETEEILELNERACELYGLEYDQLIGRSMKDFTVDVARGDEFNRKVLVEGRQTDFESVHHRSDGSTVHVLINTSRIDFEGRAALLSITRDMTSLHETAGALQVAETFTSAVLDSTDALVLVISPAGNVVRINRAGEETSGYRMAELVGRPFWDALMLPEDRQQAQVTFQRTLHERLRREYQLRLPRRDGAVRWVAWRNTFMLGAEGGVTFVIVTGQDITEELINEQRRIQSLKMESLGQLAGGVAHDFNNLLTVILGNLEMIEMDTPADALPRKRLPEIQRAAYQAARLTRQLLTFGRRAEMRPVVLDINEVTANLLVMLKRVIGEDVVLETQFEEGLPRTYLDPGQFEQILMNLVINARHAMPEGGRLTIATRMFPAGHARIADHPELEEKDYLCLTVTDTGCGMDEEVKRRLFEPFFTTKGEKGTGLGLATVYGIVRQNGGVIEVASAPGEGSRFEIILPAVDERAVSDRKSPGPGTYSPGGGESILLVEDEEVVRNLACDILEQLAYRVTAFGDPNKALAFAEDRENPIDLMLTDIVMPQLSGVALTEQIRRIRPEMPVIFMSGYTDHPQERLGLDDRTTFFLSKPFTISALSTVVRRICGGH
jgi:PAS domain S-box-containing protein